ncbi:hypothetical protein BJY04DRAFT_111250 [Aspergillus karnatakaensis]|uniref:uncharacterized protein n=1 Tax=Aspergillus karnatakaensis TaxID=1810916 RepID=UPI003CCCFDB3
MCHKITWYHVLCLHQSQARTLNVCCKDALQCNYDCGILESWSIPIMGACPSCLSKATSARQQPQKTTQKTSRNTSRKTRSYEFTPILEKFEDELLAESDDSCLSSTHSDDSIHDLELFDMVTF